MKDIITIINNEFVNLSKKQKKIANVILNNTAEIAFMTASKLGAMCEVSESTVVRFAMEIGYNGYPEMQTAIEDYIKTMMKGKDRIAVTNRLVENNNNHILKMVMESDINRLHKNIERVSTEEFDEIVENINKARKIYIVGSGNILGMSNYFYYYLNIMKDNVVFLDEQHSYSYTDMMGMNEEDLLIVLSFPRYFYRTEEIARLAKGKKCKICLLTDSLTSPVCEYADNKIITSSNFFSIIDSIVSPISIINAILVSVSLCNKHSIDRYNELEQFWIQNNMYSFTEE